MSKRRRDILTEFRDYFNGLSPEAQDVARRLLFAPVVTTTPTTPRKSRADKGTTRVAKVNGGDDVRTDEAAN